MVITRGEIENMYEQTRGDKGVERGVRDKVGSFMDEAKDMAMVVKLIKEIIKNNPDKKIVLDYPLQMKE